MQKANFRPHDYLMGAKKGAHYYLIVEFFEGRMRRIWITSGGISRSFLCQIQFEIVFEKQMI
jgi:hypothetical protein